MELCSKWAEWETISYEKKNLKKNSSEEGSIIGGIQSRRFYFTKNTN